MLSVVLIGVYLFIMYREKLDVFVRDNKKPVHAPVPAPIANVAPVAVPVQGPVLFL